VPEDPAVLEEPAVLEPEVLGEEQAASASAPSATAASADLTRHGRETGIDINLLH
jgi:hypothetical protein